MTSFVPLRYSLPLPSALTDLASGTVLDTLLDDVGIVSTATGETDALAFDLHATIAVRKAIELAIPAVPGVQLRLFAGIDETQLNQFSVGGGWRRAGGVEITADLPLELRLAIPGLRPAIVDADGPRPDPARPNLAIQLTSTVRYATGEGVSVDVPGGLNLPPVLLGSSGFALEMHGLTLQPDPFALGLSSATLHFPKSLHPMAKQVAVTDARLTAAGFSGTVSWAPAAGSLIPLPGDLNDHLHLAITGASVTFADNVLTDGIITVDFDDVALPLPGLSGTALLIGAGAGVTVHLTTSADGVAFTIAGVTAGLRVSPQILRPVDADGDPDPELPAIELALGQIDVGIGADGKVFADLALLSLDLPRAMVGESGVLIEAHAITVHLDDAHLPAGRAAGWRGVHIGTASLTLPGELGEKIGTLSLSDAEIGNGGFTGRVAVDWNPVLDLEVSGLAFTLRHAEVEFAQNALVAGAIDGTVELPFFDGPIGVAIGLSLDGGFAVKLSAVQPPGTTYQGGLVSLHKDGVLDLTLESVGFAIQGGRFSVSIAGQITPLIGGLDWPGFRVQELSIDSEGHVKLEGGWLELRDQYVLSLYGFQLEIVKIGFGTAEDGRRWIGFSGGLKLVDGLTAGASVEGLRVLWDPATGATSLTLNGVGVEFEVPGTVYFKGGIAMTEPAPGVTRFDGDIILSITAIGLEIEAQLVVGYDRINDYPFFAIYLGVQLPAGIPLWATGLGLFGVAGLFALQMEPDKHADEAWYAIQPAPSWYHRQTVGVTDLKKWRNQEGSLALGGGVTIGTMADNGYTFAGRFLLGIVFPGPILFIEGRANLLKERASLRDEPMFRALVVLDARAGTFLMGMDAQYKYDDSGALIEVGGGAEAFFDFNNPNAWHLYLGIDEPPERRIRAEIFEKLFEANAYVMLDAQRLKMGAWIGYDKSWKFGPLSVVLQAWIEGGATLNWKPPYLTGYLWLHGHIEARAFGFGFGLGADARIDAGVFDPFFVRAELSVSLDLPWPLPDPSAHIVLAWGPDPEPPALPAPLKEVSIDHLKVSTSWPLPAAGADPLLLPAIDGDGDGFFVDPVPPPVGNVPPPATAPVVPLDARPRLTFGRPVHDDALVGVNPSVVFPGSSPDPGWEWIGDPELNQGPARARTGLAELVLQRWTGTSWTPVARKGSTPNAPGVAPLFGAWAAMPQLPAGTPAPGSDSPTANVKLWLWSRSPFDFTRNTGAAWDDWFANEYPAYPCISIPKDREICCGFDDTGLGTISAAPWICPDHPELAIGWLAPPVAKIVELDRGARRVHALRFGRGSTAVVRIATPAKSVTLTVDAGPIDERSLCVELTKLDAGALANPAQVEAFRFTVFDFQGRPAPQVTIRPWGPAGIAMDAGWRTSIDLGGEADAVEATLTAFGQPARLAGIDRSGATVATAAMVGPQKQPETVRLDARPGTRIVELRIEAPSDELGLHRVCRITKSGGAVVATARDARGAVLGRYAADKDRIEVPGRELAELAVSGSSEHFSLVRVCWVVGVSEAERRSREEMVHHIQRETARWQDEGAVLAPFTSYRLDVTTTVEIRGFAYDARFNGTRTIAQSAYFRTEGPPALAALSTPRGSPLAGAAPTGPQDPPSFATGLADLGLYVAQTIPPTVPPPGQPPALPRPVFRAYDVGVQFNEDYVEQMYRSAARDLGLYLFDANGVPARDALGRLLDPPNRWGRMPTLALSASDERWLRVIDNASCTETVDRSTIPRNATLGSDGHVLEPATLYEARLVPFLARDGFADYQLGATASGTGGALAAGLHRWTVRDVGGDSAPSRWIVREGGNPAGRFIEQTSDVSLGAAARTASFPGGTFLTRAASPQLAADHPDQPAAWTDYRATLFVRSSDDDLVGLAVRVTGNDGYVVYLDRQLARRRLIRLTNNAATVLAEAPGGYASDRDYALSVEAVGSRLRVHLDGEPVFDVIDRTYTTGSVALFCAANAGAAFTDVRVDDLRATARVAYRFAFATSQFADFQHAILSYPDRTWTAAPPNAAAVTAMGAAIVAAIGVAIDPVANAPAISEAEARAYAALATAALGTAAWQPVDQVDVTRLIVAGQAKVLLVRTPEPIDWRRSELAIAHAAEETLVPSPPTTVRVARVGFGRVGAPDDEYVSLVLLAPASLDGARIERRTIPSTGAPPAWELWAKITDPITRASGSRLAVIAGSAIPASLGDDAAVLLNQAATGFQPAFPSRGIDLRVVLADDTVAHASRFLPPARFNAVAAARVVRSADGTGLAILIPGNNDSTLAAAQYRLAFRFRRDNHARDASSLVLSQGGDTSDETVYIDLPWATSTGAP